MASLQSRFSAVLRTPLSAAGGALHSDAGAYPTEAVADILPGQQLSAAERLGVYQRQYWMRLLRHLQEQYPLTVELCGAWGFNQWAIEFLISNPPRGCDLGTAVEGFDVFVEGLLRGDVARAEGAPALPRAALLEASRWDAAFRRVFMAPLEPPFQLSREGAARLATQRLRFSRAFACVDDHWAFLELRARIRDAAGSKPGELPRRHARRKSWALYRTERGLAHEELQPEETRLIDLLQHHPLATALAMLESEADPDAVIGLPLRTERFFERAVRRGFFAGFD